MDGTASNPYANSTLVEYEAMFLKMAYGLIHMHEIYNKHSIASLVNWVQSWCWKGWYCKLGNSVCHSQIQEVFVIVK